MSELDGKTAIVTGASKGIGEATVHELISRGVNVIAGSRDLNNLEYLMSRLSGHPDKVHPMKCDVSNYDDVKQMTQFALDRFGKIDILVNNAGIALIGPFEEFSEDQWDQQINVNLKSVFLGCKAVIPEMKKNNSGSIINLSSIAGLVGLQGCAAYNASKGGVRLLTKSIAIEYGPNKIRCNSIHPGFMATNMNDPKKIAERGRDFEAIIETIPLKSMGNAEDIANCALYLASDESSYVTGSEYVVDGGWTTR